MSYAITHVVVFFGIYVGGQESRKLTHHPTGEFSEFLVVRQENQCGDVCFGKDSSVTFSRVVGLTGSILI